MLLMILREVFIYLKKNMKSKDALEAMKAGIKHGFLLLSVNLLFLLPNLALGEGVQKVKTLTFSGETEIDHNNISGVAIRGEFIVIGSDEGANIQVLKKTCANTYLAEQFRMISFDNDDVEIDIEGIAQSKEYVYVIGSHSRKRKKVKKGKTVLKNRKRLETIAIEPSREQLFRLCLDEDGQLVNGSIKKISLRNIFANHSVLALFQPLPSKENGIDIEGLAVNAKGQIFIGFRGPILRGNFTPVMILTFDEDKFKAKKLKHEIKYVNLDGRGIRGLTEFRDGFLILGGPVGDGSTSFQLFFWDGEDTVPGKNNPNASEHVKPICEIPLPNTDAKAEGVEFIEESDGKLYILVVYDGEENGGPTVFSCSYKH